MLDEDNHDEYIEKPVKRLQKLKELSARKQVYLILLCGKRVSILVCWDWLHHVINI